jgi:hypothetical protein
VKGLTYQIQILPKLSCQYTKQNFEPTSINFSIFFLTSITKDHPNIHIYIKCVSLRKFYGEPAIKIYSQQQCWFNYYYSLVTFCGCKIIIIWFNENKRKQLIVLMKKYGVVYFY